jgi:hypothetical protein
VKRNFEANRVREDNAMGVERRDAMKGFLGF